MRIDSALYRFVNNHEPSRQAAIRYYRRYSADVTIEPKILYYRDNERATA